MTGCNVWEDTNDYSHLVDTKYHSTCTKVHDPAKEICWKCIQENKKGQQQVQGLVGGRKGIYGENDKSDQG
jgi:hypothetical protein